MTRASAVFQELSTRLNADLVKQINGIYLFKIDDADWTVDLKNGSGSVQEGAHGTPGCTIIMKEGDFVDLMTGKITGQSAFMSGQLKIKGGMPLAMKLGKLASAKPKL